MKLSEAMRLGAMALPPVHGPMFEQRVTEDGRRVLCGACAIGAILYAILGDEVDQARSTGCRVELTRQLVMARWPWTRAAVQNPVTETNGSIVNACIDLFERHRWTREQIADWIATIEPADEPVTSEAVPVASHVTV